MGMFSSKSKAVGEPQENRQVDTVIGPDAVFEGDLRTRNSVCIEGTVKGNVYCEGRVILNKSGLLEADVVAEYISVNGKVLGNVKAGKQLDVGETGLIQGDVDAAAITIARGGVLKGSCSMAAESAAADRDESRKSPTRTAEQRRARATKGNGATPPPAEDAAGARSGEAPLQ